MTTPLYLNDAYHVVRAKITTNRGDLCHHIGQDIEQFGQE